MLKGKRLHTDNKKAKYAHNLRNITDIRKPTSFLELSGKIGKTKFLPINCN
jgi:hypothetical protein